MTTVNRSRQVRSFFVPGFVIGFLLTGSIVCGGLGMLLGLDELSLADIRNSGQGWIPPEATPTPEAVAQTEDAPIVDALASTFAAGEQVFNITTSRVNIRSSPGHLGKPGEDIYAQAQPGDRMEIVEGPAYADNLIWWLIRYTGGDGNVTTGWVAEATSTGVTILGK